MIKRVFCLILAALALLALAACGDADPTEPAATQPTVAPTQATADEAEDEDGDMINLAAFIRGFHQDAEIEEQVIYDVDGVRVTVDSLRYDPITGVALLFKAENSTDENLLLQVDTSAVNNYMMTVDFNMKVNAGKKSEGELVIPYTELALAGVDRLATVEFSLRLLNQADYRVLVDCEPAVITTSVADDCTTDYDAEGQTVLDADGYRIVLRGIDEGHRISDSSVLIIYMYNGSDRSVSVQSGAVIVNGYELTSAMTTTVMPGKHAVDMVPFFEMDLEEYGIESIETVEISFRIMDEETWDLIVETPVVKIENE